MKRNLLEITVNVSKERLALMGYGNAELGGELELELLCLLVQDYLGGINIILNRDVK